MLSNTDWSLHRKGPVDQVRHAEKIREAIKENLSEIISEESIITSDGKRVVKVPIRTLMSAFGQVQDPRFVIVTIAEKADVYPALQKARPCPHLAGVSAVSSPGASALAAGSAAAG